MRLIFNTNVCVYFEVPRVFLDGKFIGGGSEMKELESSGQLVAKLKDVGAL
jgi:glutaredoxin